MATIVRDPTLQDMKQTLTDQLEGTSAADREQAAFWFAFQWADAEHPNLTAALAASTFKPDPSANGPDDDWGLVCLIMLEAEYIVEDEEP